MKAEVSEPLRCNEVFKEIITKGKEKNEPESFLLEKYFNKGFIKIKDLTNEYKEKAIFLFNSYKNIDYGEAEVIALALQEKKKFVLIDEKFARNVAKLYNIKPIGSLGVLVLGYKKDILSEKEIKNIIDKILSINFRISSGLIRDFWESINQIKKEKNKKPS